MDANDTRCTDALREIGRIAGEFLEASREFQDSSEEGAADVTATLGCRIMMLPERLQDRAAGVATRINPVNAPLEQQLHDGASPDRPLRLTLTTSKYWGPVSKRLTVSFLESTPTDLRTRILSHMNAWAQACGISFALTAGTGDVRISRGPGGYWSYLGTDIRLVPAGRQTMNLQGFTMNTPETEYRRVVRHETGHTLGFPHEHMRKALVDRIDPQKAYAYFLRTQGWSRAMVDAQVLTPLDARTIIGTEPDQDSIMCYQLPGTITRDGQPIRGGTDINQSDFAFAGLIYPKVLRSAAGEAADTAPAMDWDPSEDPAEDSVALTASA